MKNKIIFGALWGLAGLVIFGSITECDRTINFPFTTWLGNTTISGYPWFLLSGPASLFIGRRYSAYASVATIAVPVFTYLFLLEYEMLILNQDHNLYPFEVIGIIIMLSPCLLAGAVCDGMIKRTRKKS